MKHSRSSASAWTSFIEVMSGIGILAMVLRIRRNPETPRTQFEVTALRVTGTAFYLLAVGLGASAIYNLFSAHKPTTTLPGLVISLISIAVMWILVTGKRKVGRATQLSPHPCGRELHDGLHLHVNCASGFEPDL